MCLLSRFLTGYARRVAFGTVLHDIAGWALIFLWLGMTYASWRAYDQFETDSPTLKALAGSVPVVIGVGGLIALSFVVR
jgi:hypothetical protein